MLCAIAGQAERDEGGGDLRRRFESFARNFEDEFGTRVELGEDRKIAVIARARLGREAQGNFGLNDDVDFVDEIRDVEEGMKDRRGDVIGKIDVDADAATCVNRSDVSFKSVAWHDGETRK